MHMECVPGGFRHDDTIAAGSGESSPAVAQAIAIHARSTLQEDGDTVMGSPHDGVEEDTAVATGEASDERDDEQDGRSEEVWKKIVVAKVAVMDKVPLHLRDAYVAAKDNCLREALSVMEAGTGPDIEEAWLRILLFDKFVTHTGGDKEESLNSKIRQRLCWTEEGDWLSLAAELLDAAEQPLKASPQDNRVKRMVKYAKQGAWQKATALLAQDDTKQGTCQA